MEKPVEITVQGSKPLLMERMATQYGMDPSAFKSVLLKTVFPQDKPVSMEQLAMFVMVAHNYDLNPLLREIYAFPSKGGGVIPILGYDGWVRLVQRQEDYDGCEYEYIWEEGRVGKVLLGCTCSIFRKKFTRPVKKTVWFSEVRRDTDQWKVKPVWMTEIKAFIQAARLAYGFGGIYDQDEAENILEAQLKQGSDGVLRTEIQMPQRSTTTAVESVAEKVLEGSAVEEDAPAELDGERTVFPGITAPGVEAATDVVPTIGRGKAQRIYTILGKHKKHTEDELYMKYLKPLNIDHLSDLPAVLNDEVAAWAEGADG